MSHQMTARMGFYKQTFTRIDELVADLDGANTEGVIDIYDELKCIRRSICRNPGTRKSFLVPRVTQALNKARGRIAECKTAVAEELYDVRENKQVSPNIYDYMQIFHTAAVVLTVVAFYIMVFSTGRV